MKGEKIEYQNRNLNYQGSTASFGGKLVLHKIATECAVQRLVQEDSAEKQKRQGVVIGPHFGC